jgi:hypothetical protein
VGLLLFKISVYLYANLKLNKMAVSGVVTQNISGSPLTFTDTSSNIVVTSRVLTVYDADLELIDTYDMGDSLTQTVPIENDGWFRFILTLNEDPDLFCKVDYLSTLFYDLQALTLESALTCNCKTSKNLCNDAVKAMMAKQWALTYAIVSESANSQRCIVAANTLVATAQPCNC